LLVRNLVTGFDAINVSGLSATSFTPPTNLGDGTYAWWAIADSAVANFRSDWSARIEIYVGGRPTVVAPVGQVSSLTPVIQWQPVIGAVKYDVWVDRTFGGEISFNVLQSFGVTGTSWQVPKALVLVLPSAIALKQCGCIFRWLILKYSRLESIATIG
jgi:hypothetical protein